MRSTTVCTKKLHFVRRKWHSKSHFFSMWAQPCKIDYFNYPKSFNSRINEVYVVFNKISL